MRSKTRRGKLAEVRHGSRDPREAGRFGVTRGDLGRVVDPQGGLKRVGGPSERFGTGRGTLRKIWYGLGDPRGGPGWVEGPSWRSGTGRGTLGEV